MKTTFIYILIDPNTNAVRYIGKSNTPKRRLHTHITYIGNLKDYKNNWIRSLKNLQQVPIMEVIDEIPMSEWQFWEEHYFWLFKSWGFNLTNDPTKIGSGTSFLTKKQRQKVKNSKETVSPQTRKKISNGLTGKKFSEERKNDISVRMKKININPSEMVLKRKEKWKMSQLGKLKSEEHKEKIRQSLLGIKFSDERRKNISAGMKGKKSTDEHKKKIGDSLRGRTRGPYKKKIK